MPVTTWQSLRGNLPPVLVMHMAIKDDDIILATHGRGFWILDNITALRGMTPEKLQAPAHLFEVAPANRRLRGGRGWTRIKSRNVADNPPRGVVVDYHLAADAPEGITLTFLDEDGEVIQRYAGEAATAGMHRFVWDMRYPGAATTPSAGALPDFESSDHSPPARPVAVPGDYRVRLSANGRDYERAFEIRKDPRVPASIADLEAQFDLMTAIHERVGEVSGVIMDLRAVQAGCSVCAARIWRLPTRCLRNSTTSRRC